jgi:tRNA pseudouridine32 synthase/23S rRNA pseudouridine746 synthase
MTSCAISEERAAGLMPSAIHAFQTLFVDDALIAIDKPAGMLSVPGRGPDKQDCAATRVQLGYEDALVVHRLDQATSGILLFARGIAMQRQLARAFASREVAKEYVAIVAGHLQHDVGSIDLPLAADWPARPRQKVDAASGKAALTHYSVLARNADGTSRVLLQPVTGRTHQLRVHLAAIGHPMVGDTLYADSPGALRSHRLLLHAQKLALPHPRTGALLAIESPCAF